MHGVALYIGAIKDLLIAIRVDGTEIARVLNSFPEQIKTSRAVSNYRAGWEVVSFSILEVDGKCFVAH